VVSDKGHSVIASDEDIFATSSDEEHEQVLGVLDGSGSRGTNDGNRAPSPLFVLPRLGTLYRQFFEPGSINRYLTLKGFKLGTSEFGMVSRVGGRSPVRAPHGDGELPPHRLPNRPLA